MAKRIDAHHHLWRYTREEFDWIGDKMAEVRRDFLVQDLVPELDRAAVDAAIAVQARRTVQETEWLLKCAAQTDRIAAVVGWLPLDTPGTAAALQPFLASPKFRGAREIAQGQPQGFLLRPAFQQGLSMLTDAGLVYEILIYADQLAEVVELVDRHPHQTFVLDHAAKPHIAAETLQPWREQLGQLAMRSNVACKLSGLVTEADWRNWTPNDLRPYLDACVESFGPDRLMAGSDWPVCLVATDYLRWWQTLDAYFASFSSDEKDRIFGENATRLYQLATT